MNNKIRAVGAALVVALWLSLTLGAWFGPAKEYSDSENRKLEQMPEFNADTVFGTNDKGVHPFMDGFEDYSLDQFPLRDGFRSIKALFHGYVLQQSDNNGYYYKDGYLAKQDLFLATQENSDQLAVDQKLEVLNKLYAMAMAQSGGKFYVSMVPDKSYYLAQKYGFPSLDYSLLENKLKAGLPWAEYLDITPTLELSDYYRTDTHWAQENLIPTAQFLCQAMGVAGPKAEDFTPVKVDKPFYGVYHAQAALPHVKPDTMYVMESPMLDAVTYTVEGTPKTDVYNMALLNSSDQYNIFLSGAKTGPVVIENPNATTDRHLILIRDSFGSSIAPLMVGDYAKVTLIDLRVTYPAVIARIVDFENADVLVLLSALALNNPDERFKN